MKPHGVLVEQATIQHHLHFDSVPYANMRLIDVARILDGETARATLNGSVLAKLLDRLMTALTHTLLAMEGRPESTRLSKLINRGLNRLLSRIPEITQGVHESAFVCAHSLYLREHHAALTEAVEPRYEGTEDTEGMRAYIKARMADTELDWLLGRGAYAKKVDPALRAYISVTAKGQPLKRKKRKKR